jgi:hypothetical protein
MFFWPEVNKHFQIETFAVISIRNFRSCWTFIKQQHNGRVFKQNSMIFEQAKNEKDVFSAYKAQMLKALKTFFFC